MFYVKSGAKLQKKSKIAGHESKFFAFRFSLFTFFCTFAAAFDEGVVVIKAIALGKMSKLFTY